MKTVFRVGWSGSGWTLNRNYGNTKETPMAPETEPRTCGEYIPSASGIPFKAGQRYWELDEPRTPNTEEEA